MGTPPSRPAVVRFGVFEADFGRRLLLKNGVRVRLQDQPFELLGLLLDRPGDIVTREEIRQALWSADTFVEFDDGLNTAIKKLRAALGDSADSPVFIETVPRRGYRFLAPIAPPSSAEVLPAPRPVAAPSRLRWIAVAGVSAALVTGFAAVRWWDASRPRRLTDKATIVLADFTNRTGEPVFDDALKQALVVELQQSPVLSLMSDRKIAATERLMNRQPGEALTAALAQEVCQRSGGSAVIAGSISALGTKYVLALNATDCASGEPIANEQIQAATREEVVPALGREAARVRERLGESLASVEKHNVALEQATTSSLEALQAYSAALKTWDQRGDEASIPYFRRATELDPRFAMAYAALGTIYHNLNDEALSNTNAEMAYALRDRVTETERITIDSRYYRYVTGEQEKAAEVYEMANRTFPGSASSHANLGSIHIFLGHYEKALEEFRESVRLDPTRAANQGNLVLSLIALNRLDEATETLQQAALRDLKSEAFPQARYSLAFLKGDTAAMAHAASDEGPSHHTDGMMLNIEGRTEGYYGRLGKSRALTRLATASVLHAGDKEVAATYSGEAALREADFGNAAQARREADEAIAFAPVGQSQILACLALARAGDITRAESMAAAFNKRYASDTLMQGFWLPSIRAAIAMKRDQPETAVELLDAAASYELGSVPPFELGTLYPAYLRGVAYLQLHRAANAIPEFQKIVDHRSLVLNFHTAALAQVDLARAYTMLGDADKARDAYDAFLELWKRSDSDIPILKAAKAERAALR